MLQKLWGVTLTRFLAVGVFNTLFDIAILNSLVFLFNVPIVAANLASASISISVSYFLNHSIVFRSDQAHSFKKFIHFFAVTGVGILGIQTLVIYSVSRLLEHQITVVDSLTHTLHVTHFSNEVFILNVAKVIAVLVAMVWNFTIYRLVIFRNKDQKLDEDVLL